MAKSKKQKPQVGGAHKNKYEGQGGSKPANKQKKKKGK